MYGVRFSCLFVCLLIVLVLCHLLYILVLYGGHCKCSLSLVGPVRMLRFCFYYLLLQTTKVITMMMMMMSMCRSSNIRRYIHKEYARCEIGVPGEKGINAIRKKQFVWQQVHGGKCLRNV